ncbi:MAG: tyrosine-type recombinase/integrase [Gammaproteobacteria bacterium]
MPSDEIHAVARNGSLTAAEEYLLKNWGVSLLSDGWSPASGRRASNRLRAFSKVTQGGLLRATRTDLVTFAKNRSQSMGGAIGELLRSEGWRQDIRTIRAFYRWATNKYVGVAGDPTVGIRQVPGSSPGIRIRARDFRLYEAVLNAVGLGERDRLIIRLLSHGLTPQEVASLRTQDVILGRHLEIGRAGQRRTLALSDRAILGLARWLRVRAVHSSYVFPCPDPAEPISASAVRAVVRRAAHLAFPRPDQQGLRRKIHATGFRHLFLFRTIRARVALPSLRLLTGVDRLSRLEPYVNRTRLCPDTDREVSRMSRRWPKWI